MFSMPVRTSAALAASGLALTLGSGLVVGTPADASSHARVHSSIKLTGDKSRLTGKLHSPKHACITHKKVVLHFKAPKTTSFRVVADDRTNGSGAWSIHAPGSKIPAGTYFVTVAKSAKCGAVHSGRTTVH